MIIIDSVYGSNKSYCPQVLLEECYKAKDKTVKRFIIRDSTDTDTDSENDNTYEDASGIDES